MPFLLPDNDPTRIELAKHNAAVYGVEDRIEFILGDFFHVTKDLKADAVFLSPPWGGPEYLNKSVYKMRVSWVTMIASLSYVSCMILTGCVTIYLCFRK